MNKKLLEDEILAEAVNTCGQKIFGGEGNTNFTIKWKLFKQEVTMKAPRLRSSLDVCVKEECKSPGTFKDDTQTPKAQLEELDKEKYHGALERARAERFRLGEAPTKRALSSEKRYAQKETR